MATSGSAQATVRYTKGTSAGTARTPPQLGKGMRVRKAPEVYTPLPTPLVAAAGCRRGATGKRKAAAADSGGEQHAWAHVSMSDMGLNLWSSLTAEEHTSVPSGACYLASASAPYSSSLMAGQHQFAESQQSIRPASSVVARKGALVKRLIRPMDTPALKSSTWVWACHWRLL